MSPERKEFTQVRRLLALKRHEIPPPGYFNSFSREVIARIQAGETGSQESFWSRWVSEGGWFSRVWSSLEAKPALAGAFGLAVCAVLGTAMLMSEPGAGEQLPAVAGFTPEPAVAAAPEQQLVNVAVPFSAPGTGEASSTGGMLSPAPKASLFNSVPQVRAYPASFQPGSN